MATVALLVALGIAALGWTLAWFLLGRVRAERAKRKLAESRKISQSTKYGNLSESFAPWMRAWPFADAGRFRFLGDPIDGIQFEDDAIYLVEIKASASRMSPRQRELAELVANGRVGWVTFYVDEKRAPEIIRPWER